MYQKLLSPAIGGIVAAEIKDHDSGRNCKKYMLRPIHTNYKVSPEYSATKIIWKKIAKKSSFGV